MKTEVVGMIAGAFTTFCFIPQVWKTIKTSHTQGISLIYFVFINIGIALWLVYGILNQDLPIILANIFSLIFAFIILCFKIKNIIFLSETI